MLTSQAEQKLRELMQEDKEAVGLRTYVHGRGCHGYQYGMAFESQIGEDDTVIEKGNLKIILDSQSVTAQRHRSGLCRQRARFRIYHEESSGQECLWLRQFVHRLALPKGKRESMTIRFSVTS